MLVAVAEKFLMARSLARALLSGRVEAGKDAFFGQIGGMPAAITWADGHLLEMSEPHAYNPAWVDWRLEHIPLFPPAMAFTLTPRDATRLQVVDTLLRRASSVVNACDAAGEGELIFDEIARWCGLYERKTSIQRLWIDDTTDSGLRRAWAGMRPHTEKQLVNLRERHRTRAESDWLWGFNLTRVASIALAGEAGLTSRVVSVGRVRSPVLAAISDRCHEVYLHEQEIFFQANVRYVNPEGETCEAKLLAPPELKFGNKDSDWTNRQDLEDRVMHMRMMAGEEWTVVDGDNRKAFEYPPAPFDLTDLQRTASRLFRWSAHHTSRVAQSLYAKYRAITYPRTDCYKLPESMRDEVMKLWWRYWREWLPANYATAIPLLPEYEPDDRNVFSEKVTDHHAIIPTGESPPPHDANGVMTHEFILWDLIVRRFITAWLPAAQVYASSRSFALPYLAGEHLRAMVTAAPVLEAGWLLFEDITGSTRGFERKLAARLKDKLLPEMKGTARMVRVDARLMKTHPPELFTYDTLLLRMDKDGLGTPATRGELIAELIAMGLVVEDDKSRLVVTEEGDRIVALLRAHGGDQLLDAKLTAFWEKQLDLIGKPGETGRKRLQILADIVEQIADLSARLTAPADVKDIVFCPRTGLRVEEVERGWKFGGWPDVVCPREFLTRKMKPSEYRDIFAAGRKGGGPYDGFVSRNTKNPFSGWLFYDKKEVRFKFIFKQRNG